MVNSVGWIPGHSTVFFADELLHLLNTHVRTRVMEATWVGY